MGSMGQQRAASRAFAALVATVVAVTGANGQTADQGSLARGIALYRAGQHDQAVAELTEAIRLEPSNSQTYRRPFA
jgi:Flp pilus assembly protein TadD